MSSTSISLSSMKRLCGGLRIVSIILFILFAVLDVALIVMGFTSSDSGDSVTGVLYSFFHGLMICAIFFLTFLGFSDIYHGQSPFTQKQVRRLIAAGFIFLALAVIELFLPVDMSYNLLESSQDVLAIDATTTSMTSNVDMAALLFSFASFCLSAIFKYGIMLQKLSDETV